MNKEYIYQIAIREWIENSLGNEIMVPVYGNKRTKEWDVFIQSSLLPLEQIDKELEKDTYDVGTLTPGVTVYGSWESDEKVYHQWNNDKGYEPIIILRGFGGLVEDSIEVLEEFRLLFNLYYNQQRKEYIDLTDGESTIVVKESDDGLVTIHKKYLKTFLTIKNKCLLLHVDSRCTDMLNEYELEHDNISYRNEENTLFYTVNLGSCHTGIRKENYSVLYAKKMIFGCDLRDCNIWPYNEEKNYIDFVIGMDEDGREIKYTCNPQELRNYFGANPSAPYYLTPVYFDASVLNKYYSKPEIYKVEDGIIRCGNLWAIYIDNHNKGYISAYLGDLGRDLPSEQEQYYWRGFNKVIDGHLSEAKFKRDFLSIPQNSDSPDFVFKQTYVRVNNAFEGKFGWPLFLPLDEQDQYNFETLRVPINNSIAEMDMLILSLVKILIDSLNEKQIVKQLRGSYEKLIGSISKVEAWFAEKQLDEYQTQVKFLRELQELRSSGTGHRKGKSYHKITKTLNVDKENYVEAFSNILNSTVQFIEFIENNMDKLG